MAIDRGCAGTAGGDRSQYCILVAGAIGAGKSSLANALADRLGCSVIRVREALSDVLGVDPTDRRSLQERGADLDRRTNGLWLWEYLESRIEESGTLIVDSLRTRRQAIPILERARQSFLVYLEASAETRRQRFDSSKLLDPVKRSLSFAQAMTHPTESQVTALRQIAHLTIESDDLSIDEVVAEVMELLV